MSKELVVSSNRHETRVAVLEDDQLVEVYFQREKEYSLAGSIHKGRVTRVLPGMQSAFVDLGLDRDAFLYVSDFFEDNEEYDKIVSSVEEKVLRLDKDGAPVGTLDVSVAAAPEAPAPIPTETRVPQIAPPVSVEEPVAPPVRAFEPRDDRDNRRSRRRRPRGRGFPDSKYAAPGSRPEPRPIPEHRLAERTEAPAPVEERDFAVLPGESLAKYSHESEPPQVIEPAETELEPQTTNHSEQAAAAESQLDEHQEAEDTAPENQPEEPESEPAEPEPVGPEISEPPAEDVAELTASEETPEPARAPARLTATLREQNPRSMHRSSRRMRRRTRGGADDRPAEVQRPSEGMPIKAETRSEPQPASPRPEKSAGPMISDLLREGQEIIVQIAKEPLGQKGARITSHIALPGRYLVYMPTVDHVGVSRKISTEEERGRLRRILQAHRAGIPGGYIVRTAGEGRSEPELRTDMMFLYNLWLDIRQKAEKRQAPALIHHDLDVVQRILRDQLTATFKNIWVDHEEVYESILGFVQRFQPALVGRIKLYTRPTPIFEAFNVTSELEKALRPKVWLKSGGYIVLNQTEALVAIDINTGKYVGKSNRLEDTIVKTNTDAVKEIVRQIRLRDLGGIIVVDFIDMDERKNRQKVMQALEEAMRADRAPYKILQFNDFGLVAITRKRVKQSLERTLCAPCSYCEGAGYIKSVQTVIGEILQEAHKIARAVEGTDVMLRVHPEVAKVLKSSDNDYLQELEQILGRNVMVKSDPLLHQEKFDLA